MTNSEHELEFTFAKNVFRMGVVFSNLFRLFFPLLLPLSNSLSPSLPPRSGQSNPAEGYGGALLCLPAGGEKITMFAAMHQTGFLGSTYTNDWLHYMTSGRKRICVFMACISGVLRAHETCLVAANVVLFLLYEIYKLKQIWLFLNIL